MKRRKKHSEPISKKIAGRFDIPEDVVFDIPRITVCDNTEIRIDKFINIGGKNLNITIITDDEISVKGIITSIEFA